MCKPVVIDCPLVHSAVTGSQTAGDVALTLELLFILFALLNPYRGVERMTAKKSKTHCKEMKSRAGFDIRLHPDAKEKSWARNQSGVKTKSPSSPQEHRNDY